MTGCKTWKQFLVNINCTCAARPRWDQDEIEWKDGFGMNGLTGRMEICDWVTAAAGLLNSHENHHLWPNISLSLAQTERPSVSKVKLSSVIQASSSVWFQLLPVANVIWVKYRFQGTFYCPICNLANVIWVKSETWRKTLKQYHLWPGEVGPSNCPQSLVHSLWSLILFWNCNNFQEK